MNGNDNLFNTRESLCRRAGQRCSGWDLKLMCELGPVFLLSFFGSYSCTEINKALQRIHGILISGITWDCNLVC